MSLTLCVVCRRWPAKILSRLGLCVFCSNNHRPDSRPKKKAPVVAKVEA